MPKIALPYSETGRNWPREFGSCFFTHDELVESLLQNREIFDPLDMIVIDAHMENVPYYIGKERWIKHHSMAPRSDSVIEFDADNLYGTEDNADHLYPYRYQARDGFLVFRTNHNGHVSYYMYIKFDKNLPKTIKGERTRRQQQFRSLLYMNLDINDLFDETFKELKLIKQDGILLRKEWLDLLVRTGDQTETAV